MSRAISSLLPISPHDNFTVCAWCDVVFCNLFSPCVQKHPKQQFYVYSKPTQPQTPNEYCSCDLGWCFWFHQVDTADLEGALSGLEVQDILYLGESVRLLDPQDAKVNSAGRGLVHLSAFFFFVKDGFLPPSDACGDYPSDLQNVLHFFFLGGGYSYCYCYSKVVTTSVVLLLLTCPNHQTTMWLLCLILCVLYPRPYIEGELCCLFSNAVGIATAMPVQFVFCRHIHVFQNPRPTAHCVHSDLLRSHVGTMYVKICSASCVSTELKTCSGTMTIATFSRIT